MYQPATDKTLVVANQKPKNSFDGNGTIRLCPVSLILQIMKKMR